MNRKALCIGINDYDHFSNLSNCENDANDMNELLLSAGFNSSVLLNSDLKTVVRKIDEFKKSICKGDLSIIYFSGHGLHLDNHNYLVTKDSQVEIEMDVRYNCLHASDLLIDIGIDDNINHLIILDACRNNPLNFGEKTITSGLARMDAPMGTIVAFATSPKKPSIERSDNRNGVYTQHLLNAIKVPNINIEQVLKIARSSVIKDTKGKQVPWDESSLYGEDIIILTKENEDSLTSQIYSNWGNEWKIGAFNILSHVNTIDFSNVSISDMLLTLSFCQIIEEQETELDVQRTIDPDFFTEKFIDLCVLLQEKIENEIHQFSDVNYKEIVSYNVSRKVIFGFNVLDNPDDTFPQIFSHFISKDGSEVGLISIFSYSDGANFKFFPCHYILDHDSKSLTTKEYGLLSGIDYKDMMNEFFLIREPHKKIYPPLNFDFFTSDDDQVAI